MKFGVLGTGAGGSALAYELSQKGFDVLMSDHPNFIENVKAIEKQGGIYAEINGKKKFAPVQAKFSIKDVLECCNIVFIVTPAYGVKPFAEACKEYIKDGDIIVLCPGSIGGALEFKKEIGRKLNDERVIVAETSTLPYAARIKKPGNVTIHHFVKKFMFAALPSKQTDEIFRLIHKIWPVVEKGKNVMFTSLTCGNPVIHPSVTILNTGLIQRTNSKFRFYAEGITEGVGNLIKAVDEERLELGRALQLDLYREPDMGKMQGYMEKANYWDGYSKSKAFNDIMAPDTLDHRFINEDVAYGLVFMASLGEMLGVETPVIDAVIKIASVITGKDYKKEALRTVSSVGLTKENIKNI